MTNKIEYLSHDKINLVKWDDLINSSKNGKVFNYSWYLNQFCTWDAIIIGDYKTAIPLPVSRKWGIKALLQPNFIQQCNWIGKTPGTRDLEQIKMLILSKFSFIQFNTNFNLTSSAKERDNLILEITDADTLEKNFNKSLRKNIKKAKISHSVNFDMDIAKTIKLYKSAHGHKVKHLKEEDYNLIENLTYDNSSNFFNVHVMHNQKITASLLFALGKERIHYILGAPSKEGRDLNSLSYGLYVVLTKFSNKSMILDFEGSSIESVNAFYSSFGAKNEPFYEIAYSRPIFRPLAFLYNKVLRSI